MICACLVVPQALFSAHSCRRTHVLVSELRVSVCTTCVILIFVLALCSRLWALESEMNSEQLP